MALRVYNDYVARAVGFNMTQPIMNYDVAAASATNWTNTTSSLARGAYSKALPNPLPSGVTNYIISRFTVSAVSGKPFVLTKLINLGSLDISGASGTFTDGVAMPTQTVLGNSLTLASAVIAEVTTALNATPGTITITYVDQDGHTAETTSAITPPASAPIHTASYFPLNSTDWGVQDITAAARAAGTSPTGVIKFWGLLPIGLIMAGSNGSYGANLLTSRVNPLRLGAGDVIGGFFLGHGATARAVVGDIYVIGDN